MLSNATSFQDQTGLSVCQRPANEIALCKIAFSAPAPCTLPHELTVICIVACSKWWNKVEMALMLETDPSEIINELITSVRKGGKISVVGVYSGYANHYNIGAFMVRRSDCAFDEVTQRQRLLRHSHQSQSSCGRNDHSGCSGSGRLCSMKSSASQRMCSCLTLTC